MFGSMGQTNVKNLGNGGTMDGDVTITGDLTVSGGISLSLNEVLQGTSTIDINSTEALLVRKDSDGGDVFIVDTTNNDVTVGSSSLADATLIIESNSSGDPKLQFTSTANRIGIMDFVEAGTLQGSIVYDHNGDNLKFATGSTNRTARFTVNETSSHFTSKLGIGGTPSDDLHIINSDNVYLQLESSNAGTTKESAIKYSNFSTGSNFWWAGLNQSDDYSLAYGTSFSGSNTMFLVTEGGNATITGTATVSGGILTLGTADTSSGHINAFENMSFNIDTDNDDTNRFFEFSINGSSGAGTELMRLTEAGQLGIGEDSPDKELHLKGNEPTFRIEQTADANKYFDMQTGTGGGVGKLKFSSETNSNTLTVTNNARVGVNNGSPSETLDVTGNALISGTATITGALIDLRASADTDSEIIFREGSTAKAMIFNDASANSLSLSDGGGTLSAVVNIGSGKVGIGTAPVTDRKLFVSGGSASRSDIQLSYDALGNTNTDGVQLGIIATHGAYVWNFENSNLYFGANNSRAMTIDTSQRVGIGTTSPTASKLSLSHTNNTDYDSYKSNLGATASTHHAVDIINSSNEDNSNKRYALLNFSSGFGNSATGQSIIGNVSTESKQGNFIIGTRGGNSSPTVSEKFRVTHDGKIGIGTASPEEKIHSTGAIVSTGVNDTGATAGTERAFIDLVSNKARIGHFRGTTSAGSGGLQFYTDSVERARIDASGNVGIGISPVASQKLHVNVASNVNFTTSANSTILRLNAVNDAVDATIPLEINSSNTKFLSKVGINVTPVGTLDVNISTDARGSFTDAIGEIGSGVFALQVTNADGSALKPMGIRAEDIRLVTGSATRLKLDDNSRISLSNNDGGNNSNTFFGKLAGDSIQSGGNDNCCFGHEAGKALTTGDTNTLLGTKAGTAMATGQNNVMIGNLTGDATDGSSLNVFIGSGAVGASDATQNGTVAIGYNSLHALTSGISNVAVGYESAKNLTTGASNVSIGYNSMGNSHLGCDKNVIIGTSAFFNGEVDEAVFIGFNAGGDGTTTTGANGSVGIGKSSLNNLTSGGGNTAVGFEALKTISTGTTSTAVGHEALELATGSSNTAVGYEAGNVISTGIENTIIGGFSNPSANNATNETVLGSGATGQGSNKVTLGNSSVTDVYMAQDSGATVHCAGVNFPDSQVASSDANTLDDYEEGQYEGTLTCGSGTVTVNGSFNTLAYTKIGRMVHVQGGLVVSAVSSPSGTLSLNLPFTSGTLTEASDFVTGVSSYFGMSALKSASFIAVRIGQGASSAFLKEFTTTEEVATDMADNVTSSSQFYVSFSYMV